MCSREHNSLSVSYVAKALGAGKGERQVGKREDERQVGKREDERQVGKREERMIGRVVDASQM